MGRTEGRLTEIDALRGFSALGVLRFHYRTRFSRLFPAYSVEMPAMNAIRRAWRIRMAAAAA